MDCDDDVCEMVSPPTIGSFSPKTEACQLSDNSRQQNSRIMLDILRSLRSFQHNLSRSSDSLPDDFKLFSAIDRMQFSFDALITLAETALTINVNSSMDKDDPCCDEIVAILDSLRDGNQQLFGTLRQLSISTRNRSGTTVMGHSMI